MRPLRRFSALWQGAIVALSLSVGNVGRANPSPKPPKPANPLSASALWNSGDVAVNDAHLVEAIALWTKAFELQPRDYYLLACKIGRAELRRPRYAEAATWLSRCINLSPKASTPTDVERLKEHSIELSMALQRISAITIELNEPGASVIFNDSLVRKTPLLEDVYLEPGKQQIRAFKGALVTRRRSRR